MTLDQFYKVFIICHATGGGIALISGTISVIARKGNTWHKKSGLVFFYGMMIAGLSGIVASMIPDHINPFLFVVGIFSVYLVLSGYRALRFKKVREVRDIFWDKVIAGIMLTATVGMIT